jgi:hypothetical protein
MGYHIILAKRRLFGRKKKMAPTLPFVQQKRLSKEITRRRKSSEWKHTNTVCLGVVSVDFLFTWRSHTILLLFFFKTEKWGRTGSAAGALFEFHSLSLDHSFSSLLLLRCRRTDSAGFLVGVAGSISSLFGSLKFENRAGVGQFSNKKKIQCMTNTYSETIAVRYSTI